MLDIPLLYESSLELLASAVVMVAVSSSEVQLRRLRDRDPGLSEEEAVGRVGSQMGVMEKVGRTVWRCRNWGRGEGGGRGKVVWNDKGKEELEAEVARVVREIRAEGGGEWWRLVCWVCPVVMVWWVTWGWVRGMWERRGWERRGRREWEEREKEGRKER